MKRGQRSSSRKLVKNKLQIGDSRLSMTVQPENRDTVPKINRQNVGAQNMYADKVSSKFKRLQQVDGGSFKREIGAKKQRAAEVYGSRGKALAASFRRDKTTGKKIKPQATEEGGLTDRQKRKKGPSGGTRLSRRPRKRGLI